MRHILPSMLAAAVLGSSLLSGTAAQAQSAPVAGAVPPGLPPRLLVGLFEEGGSWMRDSGVPWDVRYAYLSKGWANNWGWSPLDGSFAFNFFSKSSAEGFIPAVQFYQVTGEPGGGEEAFLAKTQNAGTMRSYFSDFKLLLERAKEHGKPVIVMVEGDGFGLLQHQSRNNPHAYAAVAASGLPELSGLPDTVAGWGLAFLQLRKTVGATNVVLGIHVSAWASGYDVACENSSVALGPEVAKVHEFLKPLGLAQNVTGATYDVLVGDPLDRDADYHRLVNGRDCRWDTSDSASIASRSFNRYAEWLRLWNQAAGKRWVLWQIPLGNSNHKNVHNSGGGREGYKDNRAEYFFSSGDKAHARKFAEAGVIALLFGRGAGGQSTYTNDTFTDGQLFMKSRAGAFLKSGGLALPGTEAASPPPASAPAAPPPSEDPARYGFEVDAQGWRPSGGIISQASASSAAAYAGSRSLAVTFAGTAAGAAMVSVPSPAAGPGATVTFRIWIPAGSRISSVQPYALEGAEGGWRWTGSWRSASQLQAGAWNTVSITLPGNAAALHSLGVEFATSGGWSGTAYVDAVSW